MGVLRQNTHKKQNSQEICMKYVFLLLWDNKNTHTNTYKYDKQQKHNETYLVFQLSHSAFACKVSTLAGLSVTGCSKRCSIFCATSPPPALDCFWSSNCGQPNINYCTLMIACLDMLVKGKDYEKRRKKNGTPLRLTIFVKLDKNRQSNVCPTEIFLYIYSYILFFSLFIFKLMYLTIILCM